MTTLSLVEDAALEALGKINAYLALLKTLMGHALDARHALLMSLSTTSELGSRNACLDDVNLEDLEEFLAKEPDPFAQMQRDGWIGSTSGPPPDPRAYVDPTASSRLDVDWCIRVQHALLAAEMTRHHPISDMLLIAASVNDGAIRLQETAYALIQLGLSRSSQSHLPGYLLKQLSASNDFVREGRGVYRMTAFSTGGPRVVAGAGVPAESGSDLEDLSGSADEPFV